MKKSVNTILSRLIHLWSGSSEKTIEQEETIWRTSINTTPRVSPDTPSQWLRLQRSLDERREYVRRSSWQPIARLSIGFTVVALCVVSLYVFKVTHESAVNSYATGRGERTHIELPDQSEVVLSHTSELVLEYGSSNSPRRAMLQGEAFFRVKGNGAPFVVATEFATVHVLGTEFNVRTRNDRLEVAVVKGMVNVSVRREGMDSTVTLTKEQMTIFGRDAFPATPQPVPFRDFPGWMHGKFWFYRSDMETVCKELGAQFDINITIEDPLLSSETVTGSLDGRTPEAALAALSNLTGRKYRYEDRTYTLY